MEHLSDRNPFSILKHYDLQLFFEGIAELLELRDCNLLGKKLMNLSSILSITNLRASMYPIELLGVYLLSGLTLER